MGCRIIDHLSQNNGYAVLCVETGEHGVVRLNERGLSPVSREVALAHANVLTFLKPT